MGVKFDKKKKSEDGRKKETEVVEDKCTRSSTKGSKKRNVITDSRFSKVHSDPRFMKVLKQQSQVTIDSRFRHIFTDSKFDTSSSNVDKRGKFKNKNAQNPHEHFYHMNDGEKREKKEEGSDDDSSSLLGSESGSEDDELKVNNKIKNESDSDSNISETDDDDEEDTYAEDEVAEPQEESIPRTEQETRRLAIVNMDWGEVRAVDLYVLMRSFLPKSGQILSVAVYPSDFGLKCMKDEEVKGPVGLFDSDTEDEQNDELDTMKLREYEKSRLRYYFAVVECDSSATADYLYKTCDGTEFERTSNVLDLRFIPDSMEFEHEPRDVTSEAPTDYEGVDFHTRALQQSTIKITWDEDEPQRVKKLQRQKFTDAQLADLELKEFIASDDGESDDDEENNEAVDDECEEKTDKRQKYRDLVTARVDSDENSDNDKDMEITFNAGLDDLSKRLLEKKNGEVSETVWEEHMRKRSEKRKAKKNNSKELLDDVSSDDQKQRKKKDNDSGDDIFFVKKSSEIGKNRRKEKEETVKVQVASAAELELLVADDKKGEPSLKGYNLKAKKSKAMKGKEDPVENKITDSDLEDSRFLELCKNPLYALDPTDPQYKRSAAFLKQIAKKPQNDGAEEVPGKALPFDNLINLKNDNDIQSALKKEELELAALMRRVQNKSRQIQAPSSSSKALKDSGTSTKQEKRKDSSILEPAKKYKKARDH